MAARLARLGRRRSEGGPCPVRGPGPDELSASRHSCAPTTCRRRRSGPRGGDGRLRDGIALQLRDRAAAPAVRPREAVPARRGVACDAPRPPARCRGVPPTSDSHGRSRAFASEGCRARHARRPERDRGRARERGVLGEPEAPAAHRPGRPTSTSRSARSTATRLPTCGSGSSSTASSASSASTSTTTAASTSTSRCWRRMSRRGSSCSTTGRWHRGSCPPTSTASPSTATSRAGSPSSTSTSSSSRPRGAAARGARRVRAMARRRRELGACSGRRATSRSRAGLVIESYLERLERRTANKTIKSIVDPARVVTAPACTGSATTGSAPSTRTTIRSSGARPSRCRSSGCGSTTTSRSPWRSTGSRSRRARPDPAMIERSFDGARKSAWDEDAEHDEAIMRYLPALRRALSSTPQS